MKNLIKALIILGTLSLSACSESAPKTMPAEQSTVSKDSRVLAFEANVVDIGSDDKTGTDPESIFQRMAARGVPGVGVAILEDGQIVHAGGYGRLSAKAEDMVDSATVFSAGSISKIVNAILVLRLVQEDVLDLDTDIHQYLRSWQVPDSALLEGATVTLRQLLSHTAGFNVHGFDDFSPRQKLPTTTQILEGSGPAKNEAVKLTSRPGELMDYSGGGITIIQAIVEDVLETSYNEAANTYVFEPLGMSRSSYENPLPEAHGNIAKAHNRRGKPKALPRGYESMPEAAASGLWTSAHDMGLFLQAVMTDRAFLNDELRAQFWTRQDNSWHGLGPRVNGEGKTLIAHHGGANNHYKSWMEIHPGQGNGIIILTNGEDGRLLTYDIRVAVGRAFDWFAAFPDDYRE